MKNVLVQYKGGGYDGCFWEWNYCYFSKDGKFHDIHSSGSSGCDTKEKMENYIKDSEDSNYFIIHVNNKKELSEFVKDSNEGQVIGVAKWLSEKFDIEIDGECSVCKNVFPLSTATPDGLQGCGGIETEYTKMVCCNCI